MRVWITKTSTVGEWPSLEAWVPSGLREPLSPVDANFEQFRTVNCPSVSFSYALSFDTLLQASQLLSRELPILAGRFTPATKADIARYPHLKAAPYTITLGPQHAGVLVCKAATDAAASSLDLNREASQTASPFKMLATKWVLPPWFQPTDMPALLKGREPVLKLQLTHCSDGGCILAATLPHVLADSHSTCMLLTRLSQLYRQVAAAHRLSPAPPHSVLTATTASGQPSAPSAARVAAVAASAAGVDASSSTTIPWSKSLLLPKQGARLPTVDELKALGQHVQSLDPPSLSSALKWLAAAVKAARADIKRFPGGTSSITTVVLRIPDEQVEAFKAAAAGGTPGTHTQPSLSTNDALTALMWLLFCDLRGKSLPGSSSGSTSNVSSSTHSTYGSKGGIGSSSSRRSSSSGLRSLFSCCTDSDVVCAIEDDAQPVSGSTAASTSTARVMFMTAEMRHNCSSGGGSGGSNGSSGSNDGSSSRPLLPRNYFGNCPCGVLVPHPSSVDSSASAAPTSSSSNTSLISSLSAAAAAVRGSVNSLRAVEGSGDLLLSAFVAQHAAPASVNLRNFTRMMVLSDGLITSWRFPIAAVDFGAGPPTDYCCVVRAIPPWVAAVLPRLPHEQCTRLQLTVPTSAVPALRQSPVLRQLVPGTTLH